MTLIFKLCERLRHPFRRLMRCDVHLDKNLSCTRFYTCRVRGKTIREEKS